MKKLLTYAILLVYSCTYAQNKKVEFTTGFAYVSKITFDDVEPYKINESVELNHPALIADHFAFKFPMGGMLSINTIGYFSEVNTPFSVKYSKGAIAPLGEVVSVPYSVPGEGWSAAYYTSQYVYGIGRAEVWQNGVGALILANIGKSFEVGGGIINNVKREKITITYAHDYYLWSYDDGKFDYYEYMSSESTGHIYDVTTLTQSHVEFTFAFNYKLWVDRGFFGITTAGYIGKDFYYSAGVNVGFQFE